jgi:hypothetical protein
MQEVDMAATVQMGQPVGVAGGVFLGLEEGQTFVNGSVLHTRRLCEQVIADEGLRGEDLRDRGHNPRLRRTCCCGCHLDVGGLVCVDACGGGGVVAVAVAV